MKRKYNPKDIEQSLYKHWEQQGFFKPNNDALKESYCIVIPPPNITGSLHMGHAFQQTIMDILIRYHRMQGKNTLWQVGTDHAGIATQMVVEQKISKEEGRNRHDYGRNAFINKIWKWKEESGSTITDQMRRLGNSVDWERERFTMDKGLSSTVREVFVRLYQEGLIYRGKRLVNWDPKLGTAISDLEVESRNSKSSMWYLRYPLDNGIHTTDGLEYLVVATTRPETILGDTAIAVNPEDSRYRDLIGQFAILPLIGCRIPIIGDKHADLTKGTGCIKITPAHDFNDYSIAKRHALPMINILTFDAHIRQEAEVFDTEGTMISTLSRKIPQAFRGMERFVARKAIIAELDRLNALVDIKPHNLMIPYSDRGGVVIEPMLTNQWYVRTQPLAKVAVKAVKQGRIQFLMKQYENMYFSWMRSIQDWCISRQLWWGHRIPAWYDAENQVYVGRSEDDIRRKYHLENSIQLRQDTDVLDTWFSSGLWTFSTLGWPDNTAAMQTFHPTSVIVSGFDILFFWVARMIMLTMHFVKNNNGEPQIPFKTIYMTGLIRDEEGQKMSKSKGNVIDPLDIIDGISLANLLKKRTNNMMQPKLADKIRKRTNAQFPHGIESHGTDALRFTLAALASTGRDIHFDMKRLSGYRNFCNKLWHASRFVLMNTEHQNFCFNSTGAVLSLADRWILTEFNQTVRVFREALDNYRFDLAARILYEFTWSQFCDWYLEFTKPIISNGSDAELQGTRHTLLEILEALLRLAHPIIPFITETIWQRIKGLAGKQGKSIMVQPFPVYNARLVNAGVLVDLEWIKKMIIAVRTIRSEMNIPAGKLLTALLRKPSSAVKRRINENLSLILTLAHLKDIILLPENADGPPSITQLIDCAELLIPMEGLVDKQDELERLKKQAKKIEQEIDRITAKLSNQRFINHAPKSVVEKEHKKLESYKTSRIKIRKQKAIISSL